MRILIVDDETIIAKTLGIIFTRDGFTAETAASADEGLLAALRTPPDLVLCDIDMPGRDGISLMKDLGRELPGCPILVLTGGYRSLTRVRDCAELLPQSVTILTKPAHPLELLRATRAMLRQA